jgi:ribosomal protein L11 methyltransferase
VRTKALWRVAVKTTGEAEEAVSAFLESYFDEASSSYTDMETGRVTCMVFLKKAPPKCAKLAHILEEAGLQCVPKCLTLTRLKKEDWAESWKRHFKPFTVGNALLLKPSWSRRKPRRGQRAIVIDPGLSFGTGQHPTTRFCLERLAEARNPSARQSFLDVGTGSGILAIAAAKLGYAPVRAFDFDPAAVRVAKENARKNRVRISIKRGDITRIPNRSAKYDVVCANLTADLLESCAGKLERFVKAGGLLVLAGILRTQIDPVRARFERRGFRITREHAEKEWQSLALAHSARME